MQTTASKKIIKEVAPVIGASSFPGKNRKVKDGNSEGDAHDCALFESELHLLKKSLNSIPLWQVKLLQGTDNQYTLDALKLIDTQEKQLLAISDLWKIVKAQPKYKKLKEPELKVITDSTMVLQYILRKIGALANGNDWNIDTYKSAGKIRYRFVVKKFYPTYLVRHEKQFMPLDFLPALEKKDKQLHDIIIEIVALVSKKANIPLWDEDGDYSEAANYLWSEVDKNYSSTRIIANHDHYVYGKPPEYLQLIKDRRTEATKESVLEACEGYYWKSERQRVIRNWVNNGIDMENDAIVNHTYIPDFDSDKSGCITPYRNYKFIWSFHSNDLIHYHAKKCFDDDKRKFGQYWPMSFSITKPGQKMEPIKVSKFPIMLDEFLGLGTYYFTRKYQQYFYKNDLKKQYSQWEI